MSERTAALAPRPSEPWHGRPAHDPSQGRPALVKLFCYAKEIAEQGQDASATEHGRDAHATGVFVGLIGLIGLLLFPALAAAHPMGNFSINHSSVFEAGPDRLTLRYRIEIAEIPTVEELAKLDADGDQTLSPQERAAYLAQKVPALTDGLSIGINGAPATPTVTSSDVITRPGAGKLPTLLITVDYNLPLAASQGNYTVEYQDENYVGRTGWREIVAVAGPGAKLAKSTAEPKSLTDGLLTYPADPLLAPPQDEAAHFTVEKSATPATTPAATPSVAEPSSGGAGNGRARDRFSDLINVEHLSADVVALSLLLAVGLGGFHALAPGHGKTVVAAYLVGSRGTAAHAFLLGAVVTITHTLGVFALGLIVLFASEYVVPERLYPWLGVASGLMIVAIGGWQFVRRLSLKAVGRAAGFGHEHGGPDGHSHAMPDRITLGSLIALGVSGGMVPCPSALVVLLSAIALHRVGFGLVLIVAFSLGLAGVLIAIGLLMLHARRWVGRLGWGGGEGWMGAWAARIPLASSALVTVVGFAIAWQAWRGVS